MRSFIALLKKELLESLRSGKLLCLVIIFFAFGVMNPAIAKLTPWLVEMLSEELAETGMQITEVTVDALTSWAQFFKNIPMALIAFVLLYSGSFTKEYSSGSLVLILTKGVARSKVLLSKSAVMLLLWSIGYYFCFGVTFAYNAFYWDNSIAVGLMPSVLNWWLFGVFVIALMVFFSVLFKSFSGVLLSTGGVVFAFSLISLVPKVSAYLPTALMNGTELLINAEASGEYTVAVIITAVVSAILIGASFPIFNKKEI